MHHRKNSGHITLHVTVYSEYRRFQYNYTHTLHLSSHLCGVCIVRMHASHLAVGAPIHAIIIHLKVCGAPHACNYYHLCGALCTRMQFNIHLCGGPHALWGAHREDQEERYH